MLEAGKSKIQGLAYSAPQWELSSCTADGHLLTVSLYGKERKTAHGVSLPLLARTHAIMCLTLTTSSSSPYSPNAPSPNTITLGIRASTHVSGGDTIQYTVDKKWKIIKYVIKDCSRAGPWKSMMNGKGSEDQGAYCKGESGGGQMMWQNIEMGATQRK